MQICFGEIDGWEKNSAGVIGSRSASLHILETDQTGAYTITQPFRDAIPESAGASRGTDRTAGDEGPLAHSPSKSPESARGLVLRPIRKPRLAR